jgi:hypothetical protein
MTPACPCRTGSHVTGMDTQQTDTVAVGMRETQRAIGSVIFDYLHVGSEHAGPKVAAILSVVETCRRLSISVREYLSEILPGLADYPVKRVSELTPPPEKVVAAEPRHESAGTLVRRLVLSNSLQRLFMALKCSNPRSTWSSSDANKKEPNQPRRSDRNPRTKCGTLQAVSKEVIGIHVLPTRSLFGDGILRRLLRRVFLAKPTSAPLRF